MIDLRLRTYVWFFSAILLAYSIAFFFYRFEDVTVFQAPAAVLELASALVFFTFSARAFQNLRLKWLWATLALAVQIALPAGLMLITTKWLYEINAHHGWWITAYVGITLIKLSIAIFIYLWRLKQDGAVATLSPRNLPHVMSVKGSTAIAPTYIQAACVAVAVIALPSLVFFGVTELNSPINALVVGALGAGAISYRRWFERQQKR